jgi:pantothenate kinase type III
MSYSVPQVDPAFIEALMEQDDPEIVQHALVLFTIGLIQGVSAVLREHAMMLLLHGYEQPYVNGWLDAADTFDCDPPPRESEGEGKDKE